MALGKDEDHDFVEKKGRVKPRQQVVQLKGENGEDSYVKDIKTHCKPEKVVELFRNLTDRKSVVWERVSFIV